MKNIFVLAVFTLSYSLGVFAQESQDTLGFEVGIFQVRPGAYAEGSYDDRVAYNLRGQSEDDYYGEAGFSVYVDNKDAKYQLSGYGAYGYRKYQDHTNLDNDLYESSLAFESRKSPLQYGIRGETKKTLSYDTAADLAQGQEPTDILTSGASTVNSADADISYVAQLSDKVSLIPGYSLRYYQQNFDGQQDAEWRIHKAGLQLGYDYTKNTTLTMGVGAQYQINDDEDGKTGYVGFGARSRLSDKTSWSAELGVSAADYEISGTSQSVYSSLRALWQATEKISVYAFGFSDFEPGYGGGSARRVYRLGYGAGWQPLDRWSVSVQLLHDYEEEIDDRATENPSNKEARFFLDTMVGYTMNRYVDLALSGRFANDEEPDNQTIVSLRANIQF